MPPPRLTRVTLTNFKGHRHTSVPLSPFTLLVGANGSGKTSVLESIRFAGDAQTVALSKFGVRSEDLYRDGRDADVLRYVAPEGMPGTEELRIQLEFDGKPDAFDVRLLQGSSEPKLAIDGQPAVAGGWSSDARLSFLRSAGLLRLDPGVIADPSQSDSEIPVIGPDGSGLATALKDLKANDDAEARFDAFRNAVRAVIPNVEDFRFARRKRTAIRPRSIRVEDQVIDVPESYDVVEDELLIRFAGTGFVRARGASEGTLIAIALLAVLFTNDQPRLLLIDDLDRGLHIEAQGELVKILRQILQRQPDLQIIATAHSPYLVDHFAPEEVVVLRRPAAGAAVEASRLSEHPDEVLREFKTGEALVSTGRNWFG